MNQTFLNLMQFISDAVIKLLNNFKFKNPLLYGATIVIIGYFFMLLEQGTIVIPDINVLKPILGFFGVESVNAFVMGLLFIITGGVGLHTSERVKQLNK